MRAAVFAPIPGSASSCAADAVLRLTMVVADGLAAARALACCCAAAARGCTAIRNARATSDRSVRSIQSSLTDGPWLAIHGGGEVGPSPRESVPNQGRPRAGQPPRHAARSGAWAQLVQQTRDRRCVEIGAPKRFREV